MKILKNFDPQIVILCGGLGSRLGSETISIPKPMVLIDDEPIVVHIMRIYKKYGFNNFILATGYKYKVLNKYFRRQKEFKVKTIYTGLSSNWFKN